MRDGQSESPVINATTGDYDGTELLGSKSESEVLGDAHRRARVWQSYVAVALVTGLVYAVLVQLWNADFRIPFWYGLRGDVLIYLENAKSFFEQGSFYNTPGLAAPLGGATYDFPVFGVAQLPFQELLYLLVRSEWPALNLLYVLSVPAAAVSAFFAMRKLDISPAVAFAPAVLFALSPRFFAGEARNIPVFWIIPLSATMCVLLARGNLRLFDSRNGRRRLSGDGWLLLAAGILTGTGDVYYAFFFYPLLAVGAIIGSLKGRSTRPLIVGALLGAVITLGLALQMAPTFLYTVSHGRNPAALTRYPDAAQVYGMQIAQLVLPIQDHRGNRWIAARRAYFDSQGLNAHNESGGSSLGTIAAIGFLALLGALIARAAGTLPCDLEALALINLTAVLFATVSGFSALVSFFVTDNIRAYFRMSLIIEFLAFAGLAQIGMFVLRRFNLRVPAIARVGLIAAIIVFGAWDQTTAEMVPPYQLSAIAFHNDAQFVSDVESQIGSGAAFVLPWARYPDGPPVGTIDALDLLRPYLEAKTLRISHGAMFGRDLSAWQQSVAALPVPDLIRSAILGGFDGFIVFRAGYADNGAALEAQLRRALGNPIVSPDGTLAFYSAQHIRERVIAAQAEIGTPAYAERVVRKIQPVFGPMFYQDPVSSTVWRSTTAQGFLLLRNDSNTTRPLELRSVVDFGSQTDRLHVESRSQSANFAVGPQPAPLVFRFDAPPGKTMIRFTTSAKPWLVPGDPRPVVIRLSGLRLVPLDVEPPTAAADEPILDAIAPLAATDELGRGRIRLLQGCSPLETLGTARWNWCDRIATLRIEADRPERLDFHATALTPGTPASSMRIDVAGKQTQMAVLPNGTRFHYTLDVSPKHPVLMRFATNAKPVIADDPRTLFFELVKLTLDPIASPRSRK